MTGPCERAIEFIVRAVCVMDGWLLLCRRRGTPRSYLPGGHIEPGEGARAALRRELREELGHRAAVGPFLGAVEHRFSDARHQSTHEINLLFQTRIAGLRPDRIPAALEIRIMFEWVPLTTLPQSDIEPWPLRRRLRRWLESGVPGWASTCEATR